MAQPTGTGTSNPSAREHWRAATDSTSNYFTASDVITATGGAENAELVVRVEGAAKGVIEGNMDGKKSKKRCVFLRLEGFEKPLGLNVTNATTLTDMLGTPYYADWNDQRPVLVLYVEAKTNNGKPGVRIRSTKVAKAVTDLFEAIDAAAKLADIDALKSRLNEAPAKFKKALRVTLDRQVALINAASTEGSGAD